MRGFHAAFRNKTYRSRSAAALQCYAAPQRLGYFVYATNRAVSQRRSIGWTIERNRIGPVRLRPSDVAEKMEVVSIYLRSAARSRKRRRGVCGCVTLYCCVKALALRCGISYGKWVDVTPGSVARRCCYRMLTLFFFYIAKNKWVLLLFGRALSFNLFNCLISIFDWCCIISACDSSIVAITTQATTIIIISPAVSAAAAEEDSTAGSHWVQSACTARLYDWR